MTGLNGNERSRKTCVLARRVARELGLSEAEAVQVGDLALVHDVGKAALPPGLLARRGPLSASETRLLHEHPVLGEQLVASIPRIAPLAQLVRSAHERWDGKGYPDGLAGEQIPLASRIVHACDAFLAIVSDRPYRAALDPAAARAVLRRNAGRQLCPTVTAALLRTIGPPQVDEAPALPPRASGRLRTAWAVGHSPGRASRLVYTAAALAGLALGLVIALPVEAAECPPSGEGLVQCRLQKEYLYAVTAVLGVMACTLALTGLLVFKLPSLYGRWRRGELRRHDEPFPADDATLIAANWGMAYVQRGDGRGRRRWTRVASAEAEQR